MIHAHPLRSKALKLSIAAVHARRELDRERAFVLSGQLLKSTTSIGANREEAKYAQSTLDFLSKLHIALKEASETQYWLMIIRASNCTKDVAWDDLAHLCHEIAAMLVQATKTIKQKRQKDSP